jgi:hypothetical protein
MADWVVGKSDQTGLERLQTRLIEGAKPLWIDFTSPTGGFESFAVVRIKQAARQGLRRSLTFHV